MSHQHFTSHKVDLSVPETKILFFFPKESLQRLQVRGVSLMSFFHFFTL